MQENELLSRQIEDLLKILMLYASEPDTHKVVEYLLRRYRVHDMNVNTVLRSFIHLHDTKVSHSPCSFLFLTRRLDILSHHSTLLASRYSLELSRRSERERCAHRSIAARPAMQKRCLIAQDNL